MVLTTASLAQIESTMTNGDSSGTIISSPGTTQPSSSMVNTTSVLSNGTQTIVDSIGTIISPPDGTMSGTIKQNTMVHMANSSVQISTPNNSYNLSETVSPSNPMVNLTTSAISLSGSHSVGSTDGALISSPIDSLPVTGIISPSNIVVPTSTSLLPSDSTLSSGAQSLSTHLTQPISATMLPSSLMAYVTSSLVKSSESLSIDDAGNGAFNSTISPNGINSVTTMIQPSNSMVSVISRLPPSNATVFDDAMNGTKTPSPNGTYSVAKTIQPSNTIVYNLNSTQLQASGLSNTSSISLHQNSNSTAQLCTNSSCQNSTINNSTELVKAYKTEFYGEVVIEVFTSTNNTIWVQNAGNLSMNCSFTPGDKTPGVLVETNVSSVSFSHRYFRPGRYRVRISCVQNEAVLVDVSRRVFVSLPVLIKEVSCPERLRTNTTYYCVFSVDQASVLDVEVAVGSDLDRTHSFAGKI